MNERKLRELIAAVKAGRVSRRNFVQRMVGLGLTAPFATQIRAVNTIDPLTKNPGIQAHVIATGSKPRRLPFPGAELMITSDDVSSERTLPVYALTSDA